MADNRLLASLRGWVEIGSAPPLAQRLLGLSYANRVIAGVPSACTIGHGGRRRSGCYWQR